MIIIHLHEVNNVTQEIYDQMIEEIDLLLLTCPHCGHTGTTVHAYYDRGVKNNGEYFRLVILRVECSFCGKTHAILPDTLVPYSTITMQDTVDIILSETPERVDEILSRNILLNLSDIYHIRDRYRKYWKERLTSFNIVINQSISKNCIHQFNRQFMQIRCTLCGGYW